MYSWVASGSIWYRHFLTYLGVPLDKVEWWIGDVDTPTATTHQASLPAGVHAVPQGRFLSDMLLQGEIDVLFCPPLPPPYNPVDRPIVRLLADAEASQQAYWR